MFVEFLLLPVPVAVTEAADWLLTAVCGFSLQADQRSVSVRSPPKLEVTVGHCEVWRRPETGAVGLSGPQTATGTTQSLV